MQMGSAPKAAKRLGPWVPIAVFSHAASCCQHSPSMQSNYDSCNHTSWGGPSHPTQGAVMQRAPQYHRMCCNVWPSSSVTISARNGGMHAMLCHAVSCCAVSDCNPVSSRHHLPHPRQLDDLNANGPITCASLCCLFVTLTTALCRAVLCHAVSDCAPVSGCRGIVSSAPLSQDNLEANGLITSA